ncbi:hypothetical protein [Hydrogenophaga sp.]|uniref:hypothetical protein n=1 Tax=Hydrogenophaga sp. TaxID=1904254 RepID=UPI00272F2084|nr:hypothetical protein [Hydrogenophaga sp.]MDP2074398.1 hypothetical protein [Hydrogenophaga sp.]MDP3108222.1 hypothetical protein [Hydrogenophaga sp.]MDP3348654.1 hypothetical protein [Hydrogenophaga sp.]MDZ4280863.1 hypothetical protein [Hydrogenophaga sp.]MDZ4396645.1 hypothetical protein [Hydrogenophaga sp.]
MKTSNLITSSLAALAVVGSVGLVFAQTTTPGSGTGSTPGVITQDSQSTTTPMATPPSGGMTTPAPATTDSMNNNAAMNEPMARADRN